MIDFRSNEGIIKDMRITETFFDDSVLFMIIAYSSKNQVGAIKGIIKGDSAYLGDIDIPKRYVSIGIGTRLIKLFEDKCFRRGIKEIKGDLSKVDLDHKDRLLHFYDKNGYQITYENDENPNYWGKIYKKL